MQQNVIYRFFALKRRLYGNLQRFHDFVLADEFLQTLRSQGQKFFFFVPRLG